MRHFAFSLAVAVLFSPSLFPQTTQIQQTSQQATGDPQALAIAQAALTALGGATAISQIQSWTFQATMSGGRVNADVSYTLDTKPSTATTMTKKGTKRTIMLHSFFVPAVLAAVLAKELADPGYSIRQTNISSSGSKPLTAISIGPVGGVGQLWLFDANTRLPLRVEFRLPAELGSRVSFPGTVDFSDYRNVGGVLYPFRMMTQLRGGLPEFITVRSVTPSASAPTPPSKPAIQAGDTL